MNDSMKFNTNDSNTMTFDNDTIYIYIFCGTYTTYYIDLF